MFTVSFTEAGQPAFQSLRHMLKVGMFSRVAHLLILYDLGDWQAGLSGTGLPCLPW